MIANIRQVGAMQKIALRLSGVTKNERHRVMLEVADAITLCGGWINDHKLFSNSMTMFLFSMPGAAQEKLQQRLRNIGIRLDEDKPAAPLAHEAPATLPAAEILASLSITFVHNDPDLRIEVPAVPG